MQNKLDGVNAYTKAKKKAEYDFKTYFELL